MKYPLLNYATLAQVVLALFATHTGAAPVGTGFMYQGRLVDGGKEANGNYDLKLSLFDALGDGTQVGTSITNIAVNVRKGLFATSIDFGPGIFTGQALWLEVAVRSNHAGEFTTLAPRQSLAPTPYAIAASSLTGTLPANQLSGVLPMELLRGFFPGMVAFTNSGNSFAGNGFGLDGVNAALLGGLGSSNLWQLGGNAGTTSDQFLGTTDSQSVDFRVNNITGLRLKHSFQNIVNVVAGIGCDAGFISLGSSIGGGISNTIFSVSSGPTPGSTIGGGTYNEISGGASTIAGGYFNRVRFNSAECAISGGTGNTIDISSGSVIGGGSDNQSIGGLHCTIGGGNDNGIRWVGDQLTGGTIGGGSGNTIISPGDYQSIGGGIGNLIHGAEKATISGGCGNTIETPSPGNGRGAAIGGGESNTVTGTYGAIPGGAQAKASNYGQMAHASGQFSSPGDAQTSVYVCRATTTNATPTELFLDGISERLTMPTNSTWALDILVTGRAADGTSAAYQLLAAARNKGGVTTLAAPHKQTVIAEDVKSWGATVIAYATNNTLSLKVTGSAGTSIRWVAAIRSSEVIY